MVARTNRTLGDSDSMADGVGIVGVEAVVWRVRVVGVVGRKGGRQVPIGTDAGIECWCDYELDPDTG